MPPNRSRIAYQPALDGLRAAGLLVILAYHGGLGGVPGAFLALSMFFTLSGYLITSLLLAEHDATGRIDLRGFYTRRFRRLMPAALVALAGILLFGVFVADGNQLADLRGDVWAATGYVANWRFIFSGAAYGDLFAEPSPVQHFWSLSIEEQFYVVFPLLLVVGLGLLRGSRRRLGVVFGLLAVASTLWMAAVYSPGSDRAYYGTDTRAAEFLVGALLAFVMARRCPVVNAWARRSVATVGALAFVGLLVMWRVAHIDDPAMYRGGFLLAAVLTTVIIVGANVPGPLRWVLSRRPVRYLGLVSYGAYLFHWPVFLWLSQARSGWSGWPLFGLRLAVTLGLAVASYHLVEQPIRSGRRIIGRRPLVLASLAAAVVVIGAVAVTVRPQAPSLEFVSSDQRAEPPAALPRADASADADRPEPVRLLVVGDSVAFNVADGLAAWAEDHRDLVVWNRALPGCTLGRGGEKRVSYGQGETGDECDRWGERWPEELTEFDPHAVLIVTSVWDATDRLVPELGDQWLAPGDPVYDEWFRGEVETAVDLLTSTGAELVWLTSPHIARPVDVPENDPARIDRLNATVVNAAAGRSAVEVVDFAGWFQGLPGGWNDTSVRHDGIHFTEEGAALAAEWLAPTVLELGSGGAVS